MRKLQASHDVQSTAKNLGSRSHWSTGIIAHNCQGTWRCLHGFPNHHRWSLSDVLEKLPSCIQRPCEFLMMYAVPKIHSIQPYYFFVIMTFCAVRESCSRKCKHKWCPRDIASKFSVQRVFFSSSNRHGEAQCIGRSKIVGIDRSGTVIYLSEKIY